MIKYFFILFATTNFLHAEEVKLIEPTNQFPLELNLLFKTIQNQNLSNPQYLRLQKHAYILDALASSLSKEELFKKISTHPYADNPDLCCHINKVEPMQRAVQGLKAWISALRKDQSSSRSNIEILEGYEGGLIKINPLANWTRKEIWNYLYHNNVPYHPLHDQGFPSIGCEPCTKSIEAGAEERSGRWAGKGKLECGIHTFLKKEKIETKTP